MERAERAVCGPTQSDRAGNNIVQLIHSHDALQHKMAAFAKDGALKSVSHEALDFLSKYTRYLAKCFVESDCILDGPRLGSLAWHDLHKGDQVRWVEGVTD